MNRLNSTDRPYDIVLFGATGFVGALTAEYLAAHAPDEVRWAIAGRGERKLEELRERLPGGERVGVLRGTSPTPRRCALSPSTRAWSRRPSARTTATASLSSRPARTPAPTMWT